MSSVRTTRESSTTSTTQTTLAAPISSSQGIPTVGRTTRSMAKKFLVLDESTLDKPSLPATRSIRKRSTGSNSASKTMSVLGSKTMNVRSGQTTGVDGLKRKGGALDAASSKRTRGDDKADSFLGSLNSHELPRTPDRRTVQLTEAVVQPTPARLLLGRQDKETGDEDEEEDENSLDGPSRFIARPPTPPRRHINQYFKPVRSSTDDSQTSTLNKVLEPAPAIQEAQVTPAASPRISHTPSSQPSTPQTTAVTPGRVMASISRFRAGSASVKLPRFTPFKSPVARKPILATLLAATEGNENGEKAPAKALAEHGVPVDEDVLMVMQEDKVEPNASMTLVLEANEPTPQVQQEIEEPPTIPIQATLIPEDQSTESTPAENDLPELSVPPPSRIPRASMARIPRLASAASSSTSTSKSATSAPNKMASLSSLGRGAPSDPSDKVPAPRKPSYPSSLATGGAPKPRDRLVSGPTMYPQRDGTLSTLKPVPLAPPAAKPSLRSVSEPTRPRASLSMSTREGLSAETSQSLAGLSDALNKLKTRRPSAITQPALPHPRLSASTSSVPSSVPTITVSQTSSALSRVSNVHRPRASIAPLAPRNGEGFEGQEHTGDRSLAAIVSSTCQDKCLKGVVAFVDVRTADGEDASPIFANMLKALGARVLSRCTESVTHVIYKSGKPTTLAWWRKQDEDIRPHIVGISWVIRCKSTNTRIDEALAAVEVDKEDIFQKRRKSMEPKALMKSNASRLSVAAVDQSMTVASARKMSLKHAPKISSPLKKAYQDDE